MSAQVPGAPAHELSRSPAAQRIGVLAEQSGLLLSHFEHRLDLEPPEEWEPVGRPDLGMPQGWRGGVLPETKYRSFAHDRIIGSLHPTHRAKWTAHELCHGLVGFAWHPGCSRFFQALSARLSEVLPVALYYFFDEAGLRRCPAHDGGGPLFSAFCPDCEEVAAKGPVQDPAASKWMEQGRAFVERELDAVRRSLRLGRMVANRFHSLELSSDGLGYAAAHGPRMDSEEFARFVSLFCTEGQGFFSSLEGLQARVEALTEDLCGGEAAEPWEADPWTWISQDIGFRLLQIRADCGGTLRQEMDVAIDALAASPHTTGVEAVIASYEAMEAQWMMPDRRQVFATGYSLPRGYGHALDQLKSGIESSLPMTSELLGEDLEGMVSDFATTERARREPLGRRFASTLEPGPLSDLALLEAALSHAPAADLEAATLRSPGPPPYRLRQGLELLSSDHEVDLALDPEWRSAPSLPEPRSEPLHLVLFREPDGEVQIMELSADAMTALQGLRQGQEVDFAADQLQELLAWGVLLPRGV
jgi:hypothetical protein